MHPRFAMNNVPDVLEGDAVVISQIEERRIPCGVTLTNGDDIGFRQLATPSGATGRSARSALRIAVMHVLSGSAKKKMAGIDAQRIVTIGAVVTDLHSFGDRAVRNFPRQAMSANYPTLQTKDAVAITEHGTQPQPTGRIGTDIYFPPKAVNPRKTAVLVNLITAEPTACGVDTVRSAIREKTRRKGIARTFSLAPNAHQKGRLGTPHGLTSNTGRSVVPCPRVLAHRSGFCVPRLYQNLGIGAG